MTPRTLGYDMSGARRAFDRLDEVSRILLQEAVDHANREPSCEGRCMALLVSEGLARSSTDPQIEEELKDIREGQPYRKHLRETPRVPGWRGYFGAIEPLLSAGKSTDGRFTLEGGVIRLPRTQSLFKNVNFLESPGSFGEIGSVLPVEMGEGNEQKVYIIGSDKFGHFLSTGYEELEAYLEVRDKAKAAGISDKMVEKQALFAALFRGVITEGTALGGWSSRVFAYGDLSANFAGFRFFRAIVEGKSPYVTRDERTGKYALGPRAFTWRDLVEPTWDEGVNCSHYYASLVGRPGFQQDVVDTILELEKKTGRSLVCPIEPPSCHAMARDYEAKYGEAAATVLVSPQCREFASGMRPKVSLSEADRKKPASYYDEKGFYSGDEISRQAVRWCEQQRDAIFAERCAETSEFLTVEDCLESAPRIGVEKFRCKMDVKDYVGWAF
jgi:hypothetical protein